jgi:predicted nucleotidyltransferase
MAHLLEENQAAIADSCRRHGVARMYLFGSTLGDDHRPGESDVDLLVEVEPMTPFDLVDAYFDLLDELRGILGVPVDLVMADAIKNPYIVADNEDSKQAFYAKRFPGLRQGHP